MAQRVKAAAMDEFKKTPYYQGLGIEALQDRLSEYEQDDGLLKKQAEDEYLPAYESEREAAQQAFDREMQGYREQLAGTGAVYDRQRKSAAQAYDESASELNNQLTKRGLGRSSLVSTQGAYLQNQLGQALAEIDRSEESAIQAINERIATLTGQAAQSERTMAGNYARRLEEKVGELKEKNRSASISLQLQIAALQQQGYEAYQDWLLENRRQEIEEKEFEAEYGEILAPEGGSQGSSGASSSGGAGKRQEENTKEDSGGRIAGQASAAVSALTGGLKKILSGLTDRVNEASSRQTKKTSGTAKKASGAAKKGFQQIARE